jgi:cell division protein FtsB
MFKRIKPLIDWIKRHKYISVTAIFLFIIFFADEKNMIKHFKNKYQISQLENEIEEMQRDSLEIIKRQAQLNFRGDIEELEDLAREKYGMHKDNEDVFVIVED